jgi:hypothetical protein
MFQSGTTLNIPMAFGNAGSQQLWIENVLLVILAIVVLHNIAKALGEGDPFEDRELDQYLVHRRANDMHTDDYEVEVLL